MLTRVHRSAAEALAGGERVLLRPDGFVRARFALGLISPRPSGSFGRPSGPPPTSCSGIHTYSAPSRRRSCKKRCGRAVLHACAAPMKPCRPIHAIVSPLVGAGRQAHDVCLQNLQKVARAHAVDPTTWVKYFDAVSLRFWGSFLGGRKSQTRVPPTCSPRYFPGAVPL